LKKEGEMPGDNNQQQNQQQGQQGQGQQGQGQQGQTQQQGQQNQSQQQQAVKSWDEIYKALPEDQRKAYDEHVQGLNNTVKATREERNGLQEQLKALLPKAEKGSELEKALNDALVKLDIADKRSNFIEEAVKPEIGCHNLKAAYALAQADPDKYFKRNGAADWEALKADAPELFGPKVPDGNGGDGTNNGGKPTNMNDLIRNAAQ
jgi:signal recognition particle GTPase